MPYRYRRTGLILVKRKGGRHGAPTSISCSTRSFSGCRRDCNCMWHFEHAVEQGLIVYHFPIEGLDNNDPLVDVDNRQHRSLDNFPQLDVVILAFVDNHHRIARSWRDRGYTKHRPRG